jgi:hypothetical protein
MSLFLDGDLEAELAREASRHLDECPGCNREFARLRTLRHRLRSLPQVPAPEYLESLVRKKISAAHELSWRNRWRAELEYRWSRIRTTEGIWYVTRTAGIMATVILFMMISSAMSPLDLAVAPPLPKWPTLSPNARYQQLGMGVLRNLGVTSLEAQRIPISPQEPKINDLNLVNFGQNASRNAVDDTVSIVTVVDRSGNARIQDILEYPEDEALLDEFASMILSAYWRPASRNGRAVDSRLVLTFSRVLVSN